MKEALPQLPNQIPPAPTDMVMSPLYDLILGANFVILAAVLFWIVRDARRTQSLVPVVIMLGAALACLHECFYDTMVLVWWPQYGHTPLYRFFNISVPTWMLLAYPWYIGGQGYWFYRKLKAGMSTASLWKFYFFAWLANMALEIPALQIGNIYTYYGAQPMQILEFPLWMAFTNSLMPILLGALVLAFQELWEGWRVWLIVPLVPMATGTAQIIAGWPIWLALNSGMGYAATWPAAFAVLGLSVMVTYLVGVKFCRQPQAIATTARVSGVAHAAAK